MEQGKKRAKMLRFPFRLEKTCNFSSSNLTWRQRGSWLTVRIGKYFCSSLS